MSTTITVKHTIGIDLDSLVKSDGLREHDVKALMGGELLNLNIIEYEVESVIECGFPEPEVGIFDPWYHCESLPADFAYSKALSEMDKLKDNTQRLRVFTVLADAIYEAYSAWADNDQKVKDAALEEIEALLDYTADFQHELMEEKRMENNEH